MIIKSEKKIYPSIFIHIPKCAGSSIKEMLQDLNEKEDIHSKLKDDIKVLKEKNIKNIDKYFIFTVLRNPWDRMVSYYFFYKDIIKTNEDIAVKAKKFNFKNWIDCIYENPTKFSFMYDNYLDYISYENNVIIDYTINFHEFSKDVEFLKELLRFNAPTLHINPSKHEFYKKYYSDKEIEMISEIYKRDIEFFDFSFKKTNQMKKIKNDYKIDIIRNRKIRF